MVLCLISLTVAGGRVEIGVASTLRGRARGINVCGRDKTTSKLAAIEYHLGTTLLTPATSSSLATAVKTPKSSPPRIALVKAECVNLSYNLVHVLMHEILL